MPSSQHSLYPVSTVMSCSNPLKRCRSSPAVAAAANNPQDLSTTPIIFLHGVGAGLLPYLSLIFRLAALNRPMILPHSRHVSMRLVSWIPTVDDMADATAAMLAAHSFSQASVVAHSYGTMVASRLVMKYPQLVHSMCLTDPVSTVCQNAADHECTATKALLSCCNLVEWWNLAWCTCFSSTILGSLAVGLCGLGSLTLCRRCH